MLNQLKFIAIISFCVSVFVFPQKIQSISVSGNNIFSVSEILAWGGLNPNSPINRALLDSALVRIASNLSSRGYFHSNFNGSRIEYTNDSSIAIVYVSVNEGVPTYLRKIKISSSDSSDIEDVSKTFKFLEGNIFNKTEINDVIEQILKKYEDNGHPFAKIKISSIYFIDDSSNNEYFADVFIKIDKQIKGTIDKIEIVGNDKTNDDVIIRELRLKLGEPYSQREIDEIPAKLNRLRFFEPISPPQFYIDSKNKGILQLEIKEKQTNNFDGIIGYIPSNKSGQSGFVTGLINISLRNIFGTGRSTAIRWQKLDRNSQELELKYLEPWFLGYPFNISLGFNQRKQDTIYVQRKFEVAIEYLATENISASLQLGTESVIPSESASNIFTVYNSSSLNTGVNLRIDTRDDPYSPTEGILFNNTYTYSRKKILGPLQFLSPDLKTKINLQRILISFDYYLSVFSRQVLAVKLNGKELQGSVFEASDLFRLGGTNSLRGYREDQFLGSRIFWSNLEYRLLLTQRSFGFVFFDTGYYLVKEDSTAKLVKQEAFNIGYGLGLNVETALGVIGVSFALAKGDSFTDGKIHFGLVSEF